MRDRWVTFPLGIFAFIACAHSQPSAVEQPQVQTCKQVTSAVPNVGRAYRRKVANEDYHFSARVPRGMTGWDGVAGSAPFHGFTVYLDAKGQSCISFEIHLRVDEGDVMENPPGATARQLGSAAGWQTVASGLVNGVRVNNIRTSFSLVRLDQVDDGVILLVAPASQMRRAERIYNEFLRSVVFGH